MEGRIDYKLTRGRCYLYTLIADHLLSLVEGCGSCWEKPLADAMEAAGMHDLARRLDSIDARSLEELDRCVDGFVGSSSTVKGVVDGLYSDWGFDPERASSKIRKYGLVAVMLLTARLSCIEHQLIARDTPEDAHKPRRGQRKLLAEVLKPASRSALLALPAYY